MGSFCSPAEGSDDQGYRSVTRISPNESSVDEREECTALAPATVVRQVTDIVFLCLFVVALGSYTIAVAYLFLCGDLARFWDCGAISKKLCTNRLYMWLRDLLDLTRPLCGCSLLAVATSYIYIVFVQLHVQMLVIGSLSLLIFGSAAWGIYLTSVLHLVGVGPEPVGINIVAAVVLLSVCLMFALLAHDISRLLRPVVTCSGDVSRCLRACPQLKFLPLMHSGIGICIGGFVLLNSMLFTSLAKPDVTFHSWQFTCIVCVCLVSFWLQYLNLAIGDFAQAYVTEVWFHKNVLFGEAGTTYYVRGTCVNAYWAAFRFHLGSLAFSALSAGATWPLSLMSDVSSSDFCTVLADSRHAYIEIAAGAKPYFQSTRRVSNNLRSKSNSFTGPLGSFRLVQLLGVAVAAALSATAGGLDTFALVSHEEAARNETFGDTWRYIGLPNAGPRVTLAVRQAPQLSSQLLALTFQPGDTFQVSEERVGQNGVLFLRILGDKGWVFDKVPGARDRICQRITQRTLEHETSTGSKTHLNAMSLLGAGVAALVGGMLAWPFMACIGNVSDVLVYWTAVCARQGATRDADSWSGVLCCAGDRVKTDEITAQRKLSDNWWQ